MFTQLRKFIGGLSLSRNSMSLPLGKQFLRYGNRPITPDWSEVVIDDRDLYTGYSFAAINTRAKSTSIVAKDNVHTQSQKKDFVHPYLPLISDSINFSEFRFWQEISTYLDLEGVYYLMAVRNVEEGRIGNVVGFKLLNPYNITRVLDRDNLEVGGYVENRKGMQREIAKELIIEIRELNPFDQDQAYAMTDASKDSQFTLKTAGDYTRHSLRGNINAPGILTTDVLLDTEKFKNFTERIKNHTKGEPLFGNGAGAIKFDPMQIDLSKAGLKDINETNAQSVFATSGVSKTMLGIEQSGVTRETSKTQKANFIELQTIPRIQLIIDALNLDYKKNYPTQYAQNKALISVNNPSAMDNEAELADVKVKQSEADLYTQLIDDGYNPKIVAQYVNGDIGIEQLGTPNRPETPQPEDNTAKKKEYNQLDLVSAQRAILENTVVEIEEQLVIKAISRIPKLVTNAADDADFTKSELITPTEKRSAKNELNATLAAFYASVTAVVGNARMNERKDEFDLGGTFKISKTREFIKSISKEVADSHINTVTDDIYLTAQKAALEGKSQQAIISAIKHEYTSVISTTRAKTISRTETQRAFTMSQFQADSQFLSENDIVERAYKKWRTNSANPCRICLELASEPAIPFFENFRSLGESVNYTEDGKDKSYPINFTRVDAGTVHPNCSCDYELIIQKEKL